MAVPLAACGGATGPGRAGPVRGDEPGLASPVAAQSGQLAALRYAIGNDARAYDAAVGAIAARLQAGTTPADPDLVNRWNEAQGHLDRITAGLGRRNALAVQVTAEATAARNRRDTRRAGDADTRRAMQEIDRLAADLKGEIARQSGFLVAERANLANLGYAVAAGRAGALPPRR
jgi:hypothetical protein